MVKCVLAHTISGLSEYCYWQNLLRAQARLTVNMIVCTSHGMVPYHTIPYTQHVRFDVDNKAKAHFFHLGPSNPESGKSYSVSSGFLILSQRQLFFFHRNPSLQDDGLLSESLLDFSHRYSVIMDVHDKSH